MAGEVVKRVCMLVRNSLEFDPRVEREAAALARAGYDVTIIAIWEPARTVRREERKGFRIRRVSRRRPGFDFITSVAGRAVGRLRSGHHDGSSGSLPGRLPALAIRGASLWIGRALNLLPAITQRWAIEWRMALATAAARPDIVHAHDLNTLAPASWAARVRRAKLVYDSHEISPGLPTVQDPARVSRFEARLIRRADAVIHTTPMRARWAAETYGIRTPVVVRNVPEGSCEIAPVNIAAEIGLPPGTRVVLHQGNMQRDRGLEALITAFASLDEGFGLLMLGGGRLRPGLEQLVASLGLAERVKFRASVPHSELLSWTAGAWCGASLLVDTCLNHRYSLPNKLFEYLAVGVPLICSDNEEIGEFVRAHSCGEVCNPSDPASVAAAIQSLAARHDAAAEAARAAGKIHRWEDEERALLDLYANL
ncbi:MAG: glycosyltransferase [Actinomycetota bacterium]